MASGMSFTSFEAFSHASQQVLGSGPKELDATQRSPRTHFHSTCYLQNVPRKEAACLQHTCRRAGRQDRRRKSRADHRGMPTSFHIDRPAVFSFHLRFRLVRTATLRFQQCKFLKLSLKELDIDQLPTATSEELRSGLSGCQPGREIALHYLRHVVISKSTLPVFQVCLKASGIYETTSRRGTNWDRSGQIMPSLHATHWKPPGDEPRLVMEVGKG